MTPVQRESIVDGVRLLIRSTPSGTPEDGVRPWADEIAEFYLLDRAEVEDCIAEARRRESVGAPDSDLMRRAAAEEARARALEARRAALGIDPAEMQGMSISDLHDIGVLALTALRAAHPALATPPAGLISTACRPGQLEFSCEEGSAAEEIYGRTFAGGHDLVSVEWKGRTLKLLLAIQPCPPRRRGHTL